MENCIPPPAPGVIARRRRQMKLAAIAVMAAGAAMAQTPDVAALMTRVAENQDRASAARSEFTFHQKQLLRLNRGNGQVAREEKREYDVVPAAEHTSKNLTLFTGRYQYKGKYVAYDRPGYTYKEMDIDGEL